MWLCFVVENFVVEVVVFVCGCWVEVFGIFRVGDGVGVVCVKSSLIDLVIVVDIDMEWFLCDWLV